MRSRLRLISLNLRATRATSMLEIKKITPRTTGKRQTNHQRETTLVITLSTLKLVISIWHYLFSPRNPERHLREEEGACHRSGIPKSHEPMGLQVFRHYRKLKGPPGVPDFISLAGLGQGARTKLTGVGSGVSRLLTTIFVGRGMLTSRISLIISH